MRQQAPQPTPLLAITDSAAHVEDPQHSQSAMGPVESSAIVVHTSKPGRAAVNEEDIDARTSVAIAFKNLAIKHMAAKDKTRFNEFLEDLAKLRPCAVSLQQSGPPPHLQRHRRLGGS